MELEDDQVEDFGEEKSDQVSQSRDTDKQVDSEPEIEQTQREKERESDFGENSRDGQTEKEEIWPTEKSFS